MIPVKIGEPSLHRELYDPTHNHQNMATHLDLLAELREKAQIRNLTAKRRAARKYNANLCPRSFAIGDLVWRMASSARKKDGKFSVNWDGPYRIREDPRGGAYRPERRVLNCTTFLYFHFHKRLSSAPLPQVSGLGRKPLARD